MIKETTGSLSGLQSTTDNQGIEVLVIKTRSLGLSPLPIILALK